MATDSGCVMCWSFCLCRCTGLAMAHLDVHYAEDQSKNESHSYWCNQYQINLIDMSWPWWWWTEKVCICAVGKLVACLGESTTDMGCPFFCVQTRRYVRGMHSRSKINLGIIKSGKMSSNLRDYGPHTRLQPNWGDRWTKRWRRSTRPCPGCHTMESDQRTHKWRISTLEQIQATRSW